MKASYVVMNLWY